MRHRVLPLLTAMFAAGLLLPGAAVPSISQQPADQIVNAPVVAHFSVRATGAPIPAYQWQVSRDGGSTWGNVSTGSGGMKADYTTAATSLASKGWRFRVAVKNSAGSVTSQPALLTVKTVPAIVTQPTNESVTDPATATFTVKAAGFPLPTYQWQVSTNGAPWANATSGAGATTASYTTAATSPSDRGKKFRVVVSNERGSVTSQAVVLIVNTLPRITTQPVDQTVNAPALAAFTVVGTGMPAPTCQWQVSSNGGSTWVNVSSGMGGTSAHYTTAATSLASNGLKFRVVLKNVAGRLISSVVTLTVKVAPAITVQPANRTVTAPAPATFTVKATGFPLPAYQWQTSTNGTTWANATGGTGALTASYTTGATSLGGNGRKYRVVVSNERGSRISSVATLTVRTVPIITAQPLNAIVLVSHTAKFQVTATGTAPFSYQWKKNGAAIAGATSSSYITPSEVLSDDESQFSVRVSNAVGNSLSSPAILRVHPAVPVISGQPQAITVSEGQTAIFSVTASGTGPLTYQWLKNGVPISGADASRWTSPVTHLADSGALFSVVVTDGYDGSVTSSGAALTVVASGVPTEFYVDPVNGSDAGDGSSLHPWKNLQNVMNTLVETQTWPSLPYKEGEKLVPANAGAPVQAGDTIWLRSGNHGNLLIQGKYNTAPITLAADTGSTPTFSNVRVQSSQNWILRGLWVSPTYGAGYSNSTMVTADRDSWWGPASDITFDGLDIFSVPDESVWTTKADWDEKAASAIVASADRVSVRNCSIRNVNYGICLGGIGSRAEHNTIDGFCGDGMDGLGDEETFEYNLVKNARDVNDTHRDGFQSWSTGPTGTVGTGTVKNIRLCGNVIHSYENPDIPCAGTLQGISCFDGMYQGWIVENNVVITDSYHGITFYGAKDVRIVNNTVMLEPNRVPAGTDTLWILVDHHKSGTPSSDCVVRNNLATSISTSGTGNKVDHNIVPPADAAGYFADLGHHDVHPVSGSPAIDQGSDLLAPALDADGNLRPQGIAFDVGAYEYVPPSIDDGKRMIQLSTPVITTDQFVADKANLEASPFDGFVFALKAGRTVFQASAYDSTAFAPDLVLLPSINSPKLKENFLLMRGEMESTFDPFDDAQWTVADGNIRAFASAAKAGSLAGIVFDPEAYSGYKGLFAYGSYDHAQHGFAQCQAQIRTRGAQFVRAIQESYPGCRIFTLVGLSSLKLLIENVRKYQDPSIYAAQLPTSPYGLMPSWINGMLDAISGSTRIVDGNEITYSYYRSTWYAYEKGLIQTNGAQDLIDAANQGNYAGQVSIGVADYLDASYDLYSQPSNLAHYLPIADLSKFFQYQVYHGLLATDRYYWVYSEHTNWSNRTNIPADAEQALRVARAKAAAGDPLGFDLEAEITQAENALIAAGY